MKTGTELIAEERKRQISQEGWSATHDDAHQIGELSSAACCYAVVADCLANGDRGSTDEILGRRYPDTVEGLTKEILDGVFGPGTSWPWDAEWLKISPDPVRNLVKAGALIAAEIDRLQRRDTTDKIGAALERLSP